MPESENRQPSGLPHALCAYLIWGLLPLYLMLLREMPPFEFVGWRIVWTLPACLLIVAYGRQWGDLIRTLRNPRALGALVVSALLIGSNWGIYVAAIQADHVFAASLGYYINPLVNVLAGTIFLGERLSTRQWVAVGLAAAGVLPLAWGAQEMLGISLALALTFSSYGLVRKLAPAGALPGLTIESAVLLVPGLAILLWQSHSPAGLVFGHNTVTDLLVAASGMITAVPLMLFAVAARRMNYSALGFIQFGTPTLIFLLGLFVFDEPLRPVQLACFIVIWAAIAIFSWDLWARRKASLQG